MTLSKCSPIKIIPWTDCLTSAKGWVVIDSLINGVCGGGIFMHPKANLDEVCDIARTMTYKNCLNDIQHGGAKAGIAYDHTKSDSSEVLYRFLEYNRQILREYWNTGADLNTDNHTIFDIIVNKLGLEHPFTSLKKMIYKKTGINPVNEIFFDCLNSVSIDNLKLESTVTGYSVFRVIEHYIRNNPINVQPIRIIIQGYGSVGKSLAKYINQSNFAKVVGIIDLKKYAYSENSINLEKIVWQTPCSNNERLNLINFLSTSRAEIFVPCANRYVLDKEIIGILSEKTFSRTNGCIISGANNVFKSKDVIDKSSLLEILVYPEWISNCGNSVLFVEALRINQKSFNYSKIVKEKINQIVDNFLGNMDAPQNKEPLNLYQMLEAKILMKIKSI